MSSLELACIGKKNENVKENIALFSLQNQDYSFFLGGGDPPLARITVYPNVLRGYWIDICGMKAYRVSVS